MCPHEIIAIHVVLVRPLGKSTCFFCFKSLPNEIRCVGGIDRVCYGYKIHTFGKLLDASNCVFCLFQVESFQDRKPCALTNVSFLVFISH